MSFRPVGIVVATWICFSSASCAIDHHAESRKPRENARDAAADASERSRSEADGGDRERSVSIDELGAAHVELLEGAKWPEGLWVGETEKAVACRTKSQRVSLRFRPSSDGAAVSGQIVFGEHEQVPVEVDADQGYPDKHVRSTDWRCARDELYDGYPYTMYSVTVWPTGRMTVRLSADELYDTWCVLQTSYPGIPSTEEQSPPLEAWDHTCIDLPADEHSKCIDGLPSCPVNYDKFQMCSGRYCHCTEAGCRAPFFMTVRLDVVVVDDKLEGVIDTGRTYPAVALKLRRVE
jgi:hypothetical protein